MTDLVSSADIESLVGAKRHATAHFGRAMSSTEMFYILHSQECLDSGIDLRTCMYSLALDRHGVIRGAWEGYLDHPTALKISSGALVPSTVTPTSSGTQGSWRPE